MSRKSVENSKISWWMLLVLCLALTVGPAPFAAAQEEVRHGLMWNKTGLPAVFPLLVKTAPGQNYYMILKTAPDGDAALAAYIEGGKFFRVLVPPGAYEVSFATGKTWQGEETLFGPGEDTTRIDLSEPLKFGVRGLARKSGHRIDLTKVELPDDVQASVTPQALCQTVRLAVRPEVLSAGRTDGKKNLRDGGRATGTGRTGEPGWVWDRVTKTWVWQERGRLEVRARLC